MTYEAKNYENLIGMQGFSEALLRNHFTLYQGYVNNTNTLYQTLNQLFNDGKVSGPEYGELKRRFGWEWNGMRLHELYFENLGGGGAQLNMEGKLGSRIRQDYGSYEVWEKDFKATGAIRGIGWAIMYQDVNTGKLLNMWINEHQQGHPAGCTPILIMDVFEHAFMLDYGLKRPDYIAAFFQNIKWQAAEERIR